MLVQLEDVWKFTDNGWESKRIETSFTHFPYSMVRCFGMKL